VVRDRLGSRLLSVEDCYVKVVVRAGDRQPAGVHADGAVAGFEGAFVGMAMKHVVVLAAVDQRLSQQFVGAVVDRDRDAVDCELAALTEIGAELRDRVGEGPLAVVVSTDRIKVEGVAVEGGRPKTGRRCRRSG